MKWTEDELTGVIVVLVISAIGATIYLVAWTINLLGGFDGIKAWWWTGGGLW